MIELNLFDIEKPNQKKRWNAAKTLVFYIIRCALASCQELRTPIWSHHLRNLAVSVLNAALCTVGISKNQGRTEENAIKTVSFMRLEHITLLSNDRDPSVTCLARVSRTTWRITVWKTCLEQKRRATSLASLFGWAGALGCLISTNC